MISKKLKTFPHIEYSNRKFSSITTIKNKIKCHIDLFNRGHTYKILRLDRSYPKYILKNQKLFKNYLG
jgi:beta-1,4-mannosyl-glycoprotein beta-1,4-N-acetylglucosaminyltransferase